MTSVGSFGATLDWHAAKLPLLFRAFFQYTCSVEWRARWFFLKGKATRHPAFALHQLEKCSNATVVVEIDPQASHPNPDSGPPEKQACEGNNEKGRSTDAIDPHSVRVAEKKVHMQVIGPVEPCGWLQAKLAGGRIGRETEGMLPSVVREQ